MLAGIRRNVRTDNRRTVRRFVPRFPALNAARHASKHLPFASVVIVNDPHAALFALRHANHVAPADSMLTVFATERIADQLAKLALGDVAGDLRRYLAIVPAASPPFEQPAHREQVHFADFLDVARVKRPQELRPAKDCPELPGCV